MRTPTTVALGIAVTLASSCSSRECVQAMDAYARAMEAAPHDEDDHAYDDFIAIAARAPKDGDTCRAVAALSARVATGRVERAAARTSARGSVTPPRLEPRAGSRALDADDADAGDVADTVARDVGAHAAHAARAYHHDDDVEAASKDGANDDDARAVRAADDDDANDDTNSDDGDDETGARRTFSVASSPNAVVPPVNVADAVARAEASSEAHACVARCQDRQRVCLDRCDKAWKAGESVGAYRASQSRCSDAEVICRKRCAPRRRETGQ